MFTTYYIRSGDQPRNGEETHTEWDAALKAWREDCGAVLANSGGRAVLRDDEDDRELQWIEGASGGYVSCTIFDLGAEYSDEELGTPDQVIRAIKAGQLVP